MSLFKRGAKDQNKRASTEHLWSSAVALAVGHMASGELDFGVLTDAIKIGLPLLSEFEVSLCIKHATQCMMGTRLISYLPSPEGEEAESQSKELAGLQTRIVSTKAEIELQLLRLLTSRLHEGRYYDPGEALVSPLEANAIVDRFGRVLGNTRCDIPPFHFASELPVVRAVLLAAFKVCYINNYENAPFREWLSQGIMFVADFVDDEKLAAIRRERPEPHSSCLGSSGYSELLARRAEDSQSILLGWQAFTDAISRRMSDLHKGA